MRKVLLLALALLLGSAAQGSAQLGGFMFQGGTSGPLCGGYTGPGDVQTTGWTGWWGFRAFTAAKCGTKVAQLCLHSTPTTCQDINSLSTNGNFDTASAASFCTSACDVATLYDQFGTDNAVQATTAKRPSYTPSCLGSLPCMTTTNAAAQGLATASNVSAGPPNSMVGMALDSANAGFRHVTISDAGNGNFLGYDGADNIIGVDCGSAGTGAAVTANAFHAMEGVCATGTNTIIVVIDGSSLTASGTAVSTGSNPIDVSLGNINGGQSPDGKFTEGGFLGGTALTTVQMQALDTNVHTYWGF